MTIDFLTLNDTLFASLVAVYTLHLFLHIDLSVQLRSYIPTRATSILTVPYAIYSLNGCIRSEFFMLNQALIYLLIICIAAALNLIFMNRLTARINILKMIKFQTLNQ
jgi:hypothetical protein